MWLNGRNSLGWTFSSDAFESYLIVSKPFCDPTGRGFAGGGRHLFKQEKYKMLKKIIRGGKDNSQVMQQHCFCQKKGWEGEEG